PKDRQTYGPNYMGTLAVHPKIGTVILTGLAQTISDGGRNAMLITDHPLSHLFAPLSVYRMMAVLLAKDLIFTPPMWIDDVEAVLATLALKAVIPKDLCSIPVERIITLRRHCREELTNFQNMLRDVAGKIRSMEIPITQLEAEVSL